VRLQIEDFPVFASEHRKIGQIHFLCAAVAASLGFRRTYLGVERQDLVLAHNEFARGYVERTPDFIAAWSAYQPEHELVTVCGHLAKEDILRWLCERGIPITGTCDRLRGGRWCGDCYKCFEAFYTAKAVGLDLGFRLSRRGFDQYHGEYRRFVESDFTDNYNNAYQHYARLQILYHVKFEPEGDCAPPPAAPDLLAELETVSPSFCPLRWTYMQVDLEHGKVKACCKTPFHTVGDDELREQGTAALFNNLSFQERRREMLAGVHHEDCSACWRQEDLGLLSYRLSESGKELFRSGIADIRHHRRVDSAVPRQIELILSTVCDLKCSYCDPEFSSAWAAEVARQGPLPVVRDTPLPEAAPEGFEETFWRWFEEVKGDVGYLQINGGEPLINPRFYALVERLLASPESDHLQIGLITNLNTPPRRMADLLAVLGPLVERHQLRFGVSQDAVGERAEYIRNGLSWSRFDHNLRTLLTRFPRLDLQLAPTMSALNVTGIRDLLEYLDRLSGELDVDIVLRPSIVMDPKFQSPLILPGEYRCHLHGAIRFLDTIGRWPVMRQLLEQIEQAMEKVNAPERLQRQFHAYFTEYDKRRGLDFPAVFPEMKSFWEHCAHLCSTGVAPGAGESHA
jgi:hypothetical protein